MISLLCLHLLVLSGQTPLVVVEDSKLEKIELGTTIHGVSVAAGQKTTFRAGFVPISLGTYMFPLAVGAGNSLLQHAHCSENFIHPESAP